MTRPGAQSDELLTRGTLQQIAVIEGTRFVIVAVPLAVVGWASIHLNRGD